MTMLNRRSFLSASLGTLGAGCRRPAAVPSLLDLGGRGLAPLQQDFNRASATGVRVITLLSPT